MREIDVLGIDMKVQEGEIGETKLEDALNAVVKWISASIREKSLYDGEGPNASDYNFMDRIKDCVVTE